MSDYFQQLEDSVAASRKADVSAIPPAAPDAMPATEEAKAPERGFLADAALAVGGGLESAAHGIGQTLMQGVEGSVVGQAMTKGAALLTGKKTANVTEAAEQSVPRAFPEPVYTVNKFVKGIVDFGVAMRAGNIAGASKALGMKSAINKIVVDQGVGSAVARDAHSERVFGDLIEGHPSLQGPLTNWMASDENDTIEAGKFKTALDDALGTKAAGIVFAGIALGAKKLAPATMEKLFGKSSEKVAAELDEEIKKFAETNPQVEKYPELISSHVEFNKDIPTKVLTMPGEVEKGFQPVKLNELVVNEAEHAGPVDPDKVLAIKEAMAKDPSKFPPLSVEEMADGSKKLVDGRHRSIAAQSLGHDTATAKVVRSAETDKLLSMQEKAGGAEALDTVVAKAEKARGAFEATPEVLKEFQTRVKEVANLDFDEQLPFLKDMVKKSVNFTKIQTSDDLHYVIQQMAELSEPAVRGVGVRETQTFQNIEAASNLFGVRPQNIMASMRSWGVDAAKIPAMLHWSRVMQASLADDILRDARAVALDGVGGDTAMVSALGKIQALHELTALVSTIKTSTARTLNSLKMIVKPKYTSDELTAIIDASGGNERVRMLLDKLALAKSPAEVAKLTRTSWMSKVIDTHNELWINALLSGPATHIVNMTTAGLNLFMKPGMRSLGGAIVGDFEQTKDAIALWRAMGSHIKDSWNMAKRSFDTERPTLAPLDRQLEVVPTISAQNYGMNPATAWADGVNSLGRFARITSRFLGGEDEFMKQLSYRSFVQMQAEKEALNLLKAGQLSETEMTERFVNGKAVKMSTYDAHIRDKFEQAFESELTPSGERIQGKGTNKEALQFANEVTFTQSLKVPVSEFMGTRSFSEWMYQGANSIPPLRGTILPFVKVPANLFREGMQYTPGINLLQKKFQQDLMAGGARAAEARGKLALSSFFAVSGLWLAANGHITGAEPTDPDLRRTWKDAGKSGYSFGIPFGGKIHYIPFNRMDPFFMPYGIIGDLVQTMQHIDSADAEQLAGAFVLSMSNLINSKGYLKTVSDTFDILQGGHGDEGIHKVERVLRSYSASHVPNFFKLGDFSGEIKDTRNLVDAFLARVPGNGVEASRNYVGDKVMAPVGWPWNALLPSKPTTSTDDPAFKEMGRLADGPAATRFKLPPQKMGNVDLLSFKNEAGTTAWHYMMDQLRDGGFHQALNDLVQKPSYLNGTDGDRFHKIGSKVVDIKTLQNKYQQKALKAMRREFPEVDRLIKEDEKAEQRTRQGRNANDDLNAVLQFGQ